MNKMLVYMALAAALFALCVAGAGCQDRKFLTKEEIEESQEYAVHHDITEGEIGRKTFCTVARDSIIVQENTWAAVYRGKIYYFSEREYHDRFLDDPDKVLNNL